MAQKYHAALSDIIYGYYQQYVAIAFQMEVFESRSSTYDSPPVRTAVATEQIGVTMLTEHLCQLHVARTACDDLLAHSFAIRMPDRSPAPQIE